MNPQSWFGVAVRCFGLFFIYEAFTHLLYFLDWRLGLSEPVVMNDPTVSTGYLIYVVGYGVMGIFFLRSSHWLIQFAHPDHDDDASVESI
ncbi:MAG: hypothetical protein AAGJ40_16765 [Planctomycetota bacterium]